MCYCYLTVVLEDTRSRLRLEHASASLTRQSEVELTIEFPQNIMNISIS